MDDQKIGVIVHDGVVTLTGEAAHYSGRWAAEDVAKRVKGVRAIANEIQVKLPAAGMRSDAEIAEAAANAPHDRPIQARRARGTIVGGREPFSF